MVLWHNQGSTRRKGRREPLFDEIIFYLYLSVEKKNQTKLNNPQSDEVSHFLPICMQLFVCFLKLNANFG